MLFIAAFALLWTWGYRFYIKPPTDNKKTEIVHENPSSSVNGIRDSLQKVYNATINYLDNRFDSTWIKADSLGSRLDIKLGEFYRLRNEIAVLLKDRGPGADLALASRKIDQLQYRLKDFLDKNLDVEYENKKLAAVVDQLTSGRKNPVSNVQKVSFDNPTSFEKNELALVVTASDLKLTAIKTNGDRDVETILAQETDKLVGSFFIKTIAGQNSSGEVMIVVLQPDGQVMKSSAWETGTFITEEGRKVYSNKIRFDSNRGEVKHLDFSLMADGYQKGNYIMQVYHNGKLIGRVMKNLS